MAFVGTYDLLDSTNDWTPLSSTGSEVQFVALTDGIYEGEFRLKDGESALSEIFYTVQLANSKLKTFIKNKYDYIFINFKVKFKSIDVNERASIIVYANTAEVVAQSWTSQTDSTDEELIVNCLLSQGIIEEIINDNYSLKIKFMIEDIDNENFIGNQDHIRFTRNVSFYAVNRIDLWGKDSITGNSEYEKNRGLQYYYPGDTTRIVNTGINTNNYNTIEVDGEMLTATFSDNVAAGTLKRNLYHISKENLSTGFPMTMWFRLFVNPGGYGFGTTTYIDPADISFSIFVNDELAKQIPHLSDCPVEPNYEFDFRNTSVQNVVTNTGSSTSTSYSAVRSGDPGPGVDRIEGTILDNDTLDSSNDDGKYFEILKNATTNELWSMDEMDFSIELEFIVYDTTELNQRIFNIGATESNTTGNNNTIQLYISSGGNLIYYIVEGGDSHTISSVSISSNKLYHVCLTYSETNETAKFYLDGVLIDTYSGVNTTLSNASYFWIGRNLVVNTSDYFNGSVRYFRMWTERELTLSEIKMRYDILRGKHNIYYTTTENLSTTDDVSLNIQATSSQTAVKARDFFFFDRMINVAPIAANVFDSGVEVNNTMNVTGNIFNSNLIGEIAMFYQNSSAPPFGYLWCDGSTISTDDDEKYRTLIEILNGDTRGSTSIGTTKSCYLPNYMIDSSGCHLLQADTQAPSETAPLYTNFNYNYQGSEQQTIAGTYTLDSNYFPSHTHSINEATSTIGTGSSFMNIAGQGNVPINTKYLQIQDLGQVGGGNDNVGSHDDGPSNSDMNQHKHEFQTENSNAHQTNYQVKVEVPSSLQLNNIYDSPSSTVDIDVQNNDSGPTGNITQHIPSSYKVKYAIKYL